VINVVVMSEMVGSARRGDKRIVVPGTRSPSFRSATVRDHQGMDLVRDDLAACLRSWRGRLGPADAGLPAGRQRRVPGLRREEVAQLAGVSVDYLTRLEQGRATSPSPSVLAALARTLRLGKDERAHLYRLAGQAEPRPGTVDRHVTPSLLRLLDRLTDVPAMVVDVTGEVVLANALATALTGDRSGLQRRERNINWRHFTGAPSPIVRSSAEQAATEEGMVAELHDALGRYPDDTELTELITDLCAASPRFAELWEQRPVARTRARRKTFRHPQVGDITLDCDVLAVEGSDLRLIVYTAEPGSRDADSLALLSAVGLHSFEGDTESRAGIESRDG
jgi:transcriptional regulator with XRE-family HTH domain